MPADFTSLTVVQIRTLETLLDDRVKVAIVDTLLATIPSGTFQAVLPTLLARLRLQGGIIHIVTLPALRTLRPVLTLETVIDTRMAEVTLSKPPTLTLLAMRPVLALVAVVWTGATERVGLVEPVFVLALGAMGSVGAVQTSRDGGRAQRA